MNNILEEILRTGLVRDESGKTHRLRGHIDRSEGEFLFQLIRSRSDITRTMEIGCAYGISSQYICSAISGRDSAKHIIVDPFQHTDYHGTGITNLRRAGFDFFTLVETPSEIYLPELIREESGHFDLVFIDGWHTFDHTLLDLFYANRLIRTGGYIVVDDCTCTTGTISGPCIPAWLP